MGINFYNEAKTVCCSSFTSFGLEGARLGFLLPRGSCLWQPWLRGPEGSSSLSVPPRPLNGCCGAISWLAPSGLHAFHCDKSPSLAPPILGQSLLYPSFLSCRDAQYLPRYPKLHAVFSTQATVSSEIALWFLFPIIAGIGTLTSWTKCSQI